MKQCSVFSLYLKTTPFVIEIYLRYFVLLYKLCRVIEAQVLYLVMMALFPGGFYADI